MPIDAQIPLSAAQQPSFAQQAGQVYQLAGAIEKQQEIQQQRQDQQYIQEALKGGANFKTPDGIEAVAEQLKGKISPSAYQTIISAGDEMKTSEAKRIEAMAKAPEAAIKNFAAQNGLMGQTLQKLMTTYDEDVRQYGKQQADVLLEQHKQQAIQGVPKTPDGKPVLPPQFLQELGGMNRARMGAEFEATAYGQEQLDKVSKRRAEDALTAERLAKAKSLREGKSSGAIPDEISKSTAHGQKFLSLLSPDEAADTLAVAEGRKSLADIPARGGQRGRIGQYVTQFDPGFSNIRNPADKAAAVAISKDISAIRPFIDMLDKNADIAVDLSKKVISTDNRLANKSINWLRQNMGDNPDVAEFLAQTTFVQTEAARVLNNPRLVGQLTDTARLEMQHVLSGDMPIKSYERVIRRIQKDGQNRFEAMESQRDRLFAGSVRPKAVPQSELKSGEANTGKSAVAPRETAPAGAIEKLKKNPQLKEQFKAKYGYLPEGM